MMLRPGRGRASRSARSRAAAAAATGLAAGTPVIAGGGDGQCAGTGAGVLRSPGRAYVNLGTAVVSGSYGARLCPRPRLPHRDRRSPTQGYIYETCLRSGTFLVDWLAARDVRRPTRASEKRDVRGARGRGGARARSAPAASCCVPYWQGCMTPHWDSAARGVIAGLSGSTRRGDIYRALLEGHRARAGATTDRAAAATGTPIDHFVAIGGGAASDLWVQILADATGRPVQRSATVEASSLGAGDGGGQGRRLVRDDRRGVGGHGRASPSAPSSRSRSARRATRELLAIHADLWPTLVGVERAARRLRGGRQWLTAANWNALIEDVVAGRWRDPETGRPATLPFEAIELAETHRGARGRTRAPARLGDAPRGGLRRQHGRGDGPPRRQGAARRSPPSTRSSCPTGSTATRRRSPWSASGPATPTASSPSAPASSTTAASTRPSSTAGAMPCSARPPR